MILATVVFIALVIIVAFFHLRARLFFRRQDRATRQYKAKERL